MPALPLSRETNVDKLRSFIAVGTFIATTVGVPATAFVIRMVRGETTSPSEEIISEWLKNLVAKFHQENK
jgi:hypothetical protein